MKANRTAGWFAWAIGLFLLILVPFILYGERLDESVEALRRSSTSRWAAALVLSVLLASDIVLPIPSSGVSAAIGALTGFWWGTALSAVSMTLACVVGYAIGRYAGRHAARKLVGDSGLQRAEHLSESHGDWAVVTLRGVPVLAEASVVVAGTSRMSFARFLLSCTLANVGVSALYAAAGVVAFETWSLSLAFIAAVGVPLLTIGLTRARAGINANTSV